MEDDCSINMALLYEIQLQNRTISNLKSVYLLLEGLRYISWQNLHIKLEACSETKGLFGYPC